MGHGKSGYKLNTKGGRESFNDVVKKNELAAEEKKSGQLLLFEDEEPRDAPIKTETGLSENVAHMRFMHSGEVFSSDSESALSNSYKNGRDYNTAGSASVKRVDNVQIAENKHKKAVESIPDSVIKYYKEGKLESERYFGADGKPYLDIDYTDHGNAKRHPIVPHEHEIVFCGDNKFLRGDLRRIKND